MADPIAALCDQTYTAAHSSGVRSPDAVIWIVLHSTEGDTAEGAARWFANPKSTGSAHLCVDDETCFRTLRNIDVPWAAPGANTHGFHIEQAGHAHWTTAQWLRHEVTIRRAAYKTALHANHFGIPLRWVNAAGLKNRVPGITLHSTCSEAFGGDHTDPGKNYPAALFMKYAKKYLLDIREGL